MATARGYSYPAMIHSAPQNKNGFTLAEILVSIGIFVFIGLAVASFERDIFFLNNSLQSNLSAQIDARQLLRTVVSELRGASPSSLGSYTIAQAATSTITFYSNIDKDILKERVRYFLSGSDLHRGIIKPTGSPLVYNSESESVDVVIRNVVNGTSTATFEYFDGFFTGTSSPLVQPVSALSVRLVRITVVIDSDPNRPPGPITVTSMGTLRNLKDNL